MCAYGQTSHTGRLKEMIGNNVFTGMKVSVLSYVTVDAVLLLGQVTDSLPGIYLAQIDV